MKQWFSRVKLEMESEAVNIKTPNFTCNGNSIVSSAELIRNPKAAAITLDGGASITTMTRRGVTTLASNYTLEEGTLSIVIPAFIVTAVTPGTISVITLHQTAIKPKSNTVFSVPLLTGAGLVTGKLEWYATTGNFGLSKVDGTAFTTNFGLYFDFVVQIN